MADNKKLDFLRVLIAAAWADGEISCDEMNNLKVYFRELEFSNDELTALQPYLSDPIEEAEARTIVRDFLARARGRERETMLAAVRDLVLSDGELGEGERLFLQSLEGLIDDATASSTAGVFVAQLKRLWRGAGGAEAVGGRAGEANESTTRRSDLVDEFVRNRVLYQVKRRLLVASGSKNAIDDETERELRMVCTVAALMGHVAGADQHFDGDERAAIAEILDGMTSLRPRDVDVIVEIVESEVLSDVGYGSFVREFEQSSSRAEREELLSMLFAVAAADGEITHDENEEIRKISKALHLEHNSFIAAKTEATRTGEASAAR